MELRGRLRAGLELDGIDPQLAAILRGDDERHSIAPRDGSECDLRPPGPDLFRDTAVATLKDDGERLLV